MKKDSVKIEKKKINTKNLMENLLVIFLILCPIFDILSFIFRNIFNTSISPSTILRPIIPLIVFIDIFIKSKHKLKIFIITAIYGIYAILHLLLFNTANTGFSYSNVVHEMQYVMNYTFTIIILFIYIFAFKDKEKEKLQKGVISAVSIYLASILLSIITKTSSATYMEEGTGIKGWFESGNSISAVLVLAIFVLLSNGNKSYKKIIIGEIIILGIFLCLLIGTRVGLLGFIIALVSFIFAEIVEKNKQKNSSRWNICNNCSFNYSYSYRIKYNRKKKASKRNRVKYSRWFYKPRSSYYRRFNGN